MRGLLSYEAFEQRFLTSLDHGREVPKDAPLGEILHIDSLSRAIIAAAMADVNVTLPDAKTWHRYSLSQLYNWVWEREVERQRGASGAGNVISR